MVLLLDEKNLVKVGIAHGGFVLVHTPSRLHRDTSTNPPIRQSANPPIRQKDGGRKERGKRRTQKARETADAKSAEDGGRKERENRRTQKARKTADLQPLSNARTRYTERN
ncbi:MAG: hypothetical protein PHP42_02555 [Bacteroidota bacterium]|nr:hypothetical protein [Bacteroidota bacterium]